MMKMFCSNTQRRRPSDKWKQIVLYLIAIVLLSFALIIKLRIFIEPHHFGETEALRILEVRKPGLCGHPTPGIDLSIPPRADDGKPEEAGLYRGYPRLIHRIFLVWKGQSAEIPEAWSENDRLCRQLTPDFRHIIWNDEMVLAFFSEHYPWFLPTYQSYSYDVMRVDAAKYFLLYHYGGIYLDLDERCVTDIKKLVDLMPQGYGMAVPQGNPSGLSNAVFMAKACHSFLSYVISRMRHDNTWYGIPYATIMFSTGPRFLSFKYQEYLDLVQTMNDQPIYVFPTDYVIKHQYIEKIKGQTWFSWDGEIIFSFYKLWRKVTFQIPV